MRRVRLEFHGRPAILYTFSPSCTWCERNLANARLLATSSAPSYAFVAVALGEEGLGAYVEQRGLEWTIVKDVPPEVRLAYKMFSTPYTVVIDPSYTVLHAWRGAFGGTVARDVENSFGVKLPGLVTPPVSERTPSDRPPHPVIT